MSDLTGQYLGQYQLIEVIGRGGTSTVYRAYQQSLGRYVAVKVLRANLDPQFAARFRREAHAVAQLQHRNILPIYDYGEQGRHPYIVTQYVENGITLSDMWNQAPIAPVVALRLMDYLLDALDYAHQRNIIHRDVKPANVLMPQPDWPLLADFGIAKLIDWRTNLTPPGQMIGTVAYMAPERAFDRPADARSDLYSVGVILYEMLTGRPPFDGGAPAIILAMHVYNTPPAPCAVNPDLPPVVEPLLFKALEKDPARRYQNAAEMQADLRRVIGQIERINAQQQLAHMLAAQGKGTNVDPYQTTDFSEWRQEGRGPTIPRAPARAPTIDPPARQQRAGKGRNLVALIVFPLLLLALIVAGTALSDLPRGAAFGEMLETVEPTATNPAATLAPTGFANTPTPPVAPLEPTTTPPLASAVTPIPSVIDLPIVTPVPSIVASPTATSAPMTREPTPLPPVDQAPLSLEYSAIRLEDTDWSGGFGGANGQQRYGGRSATWIYGQGTGYETMRTAFDVDGPLQGSARLTVEGMDSEGRAKTEISILINDVEIYTGPNPLPDDDIPLETGTWAAYTWDFDASLLQPGRNVIVISNLSPGAFSLPPFFMLDYAEVEIVQ
jgi:serine/threonine-protein kinase